MADVDVKCDSCGTTVTVSEFVDFDKMYCRRCGDKIRSNDGDKQKSRLKLKPQESAAQANTETLMEEVKRKRDRETVDGHPRHSTQNATVEYRKKMRLTHHLVSWILFVLIGGVMAYLRYGDGFQSPTVQQALSYGPYVIIGFHILITLQALKDSVFQGILCLLVPMYSFYYLFLVSDNFYLRAIVAGMLVGIVQDSLLSFQVKITEVIDIVQRWIASGG